MTPYFPKLLNAVIAVTSLNILGALAQPVTSAIPTGIITLPPTQCGGGSYVNPSLCRVGYECVELNKWYWECVKK
ncbi:hypothetical protein FA15DRAFT_674750 [Coprinopsis marcescibilis]|uniref:CBM1 domain-containing protein n=1 Tax=Coprinopsis marcescibilis TaxID=230819 RepID=A0A5C3KG95_COPMA|nr:hypothetical protein FA15DRAFT_674750 [Coprinopsis marcescibilis]